MLPIDELRRREEQRLLPALAAWDEAKKILENAIALAENREREYREIADDVQQRLGALQTVIGMTQELEASKESMAVPAIEESRTSLASDQPLQNGLVRVSSRRLFSASWRSNESSLSILESASRLRSRNGK
jgi:hypothetical protein